MAITLSFLALMISLIALRAVSQSNQLHKALMRSEGEREQLELTICSLIDGDGEVVNLALPAASETAQKIRAEEAARKDEVIKQAQDRSRMARELHYRQLASSVSSSNSRY